MKKFKHLITIFLIALIAAMPAIAQEKPKIAVYVASDELKDNEKRMLATKILAPFVQSGHFKAIERSEAFTSGIARERQKQRDGSVDDSQISRLGKESGVQFVCVADFIDAFGIYNVSARLIDTETAEIIGMGVAEMKNMGEIGKAADEIYEQIRGGSSARKAPMAATPVAPAAPAAPAIQVVFVPTPEPAKQSTTEYKNFTAGRRWGTFWLNTVAPGIGSFTLMKDVFGGIVHMGLITAAFFALMDSESQTEECYSYSSYCNYEYDYTWVQIFYLSHVVWNIVRSASYDKPNRNAMLEPSNFNFAVLPSRNGNSLKPGVFYNASF
jgi:hypothetical protein